MRKIIGFLSLLFLTVMVLGLLPVRGEEKIYSDVLRLHVIANSDTEADQALKLRVRDGILAQLSTLLADCPDFAAAEARLGDESVLRALRESAEEILQKEGARYPVTVTLRQETYPRKRYEALCFPSGRYTSLRVQIGQAEGQNWWCVLFPQLCLNAASGSVEENEEEFIEAGFTPEQYKIVTESDEPRYEVKFKILELIEKIAG
ncbi:MAG: stage II sporulation protein R [Clostridia bacterium]|nr:stage II sporulation protein R [Clostridia bacterium]